VTRFWDDDHGMFIDEWDTRWLHPDGCRGMNADLHAVEALLAAYDATADRDCLRRSLTVTRHAVRWARECRWRLPEHFDAAWRPGSTTTATARWTRSSLSAPRSATRWSGPG
jgi:sulfoquinovose isomerase